VTQASTVIIGIGNRYRGDDALGCIVAAELGSMSLPGVRCIEHDGEPAALIESWQGVEQVVLIDAVSSGAAAGTVRHFDLAKQALPEEFNLYSTHAFGVPQAVELARALDKLPPQIAFVGVEGECFDAGVELSAAVRQAKDIVIAEILNSLSLGMGTHA